MPLYDFECPNCGRVVEMIVPMDSCDDEFPCPTCLNVLKKIITLSGVHCANEDGDWIRSVTEVVDKEDKRPAHQDFLRSPTRTNYKRWMKEAGIRPMEPGEKPTRKEVDLNRLTEKTFERVRARERIEINGLR